MNIQLSDHFTYKKLIRFTIPTVLMLVFTSIYSIVDGFFVSNYVGETPFAAQNLIWPFVQILSAIGFMMGAGGSAVIGKTLGEGNSKKANEYFSMVVIVTAVLSFVLSAIGIANIREIAIIMGSDESMLEYCMSYGSILLSGIFVYTLQILFQTIMITAGKPRLSFYITLASGLTNIVLDYVVVGVWGWGLNGAGYATVASEIVGAVVPIFYFTIKNDSLLRFGNPRFDFKVLIKIFGNGSSELVSNISASVVSIVFNLELMKYLGQNGVSAYGVMMYISFVFFAIFFGYCMGSAPIVSFHYGAKNREEIRNLFKKSLILVGGAGVFMSVVAFIFARPLTMIFVGYNEELLNMTTYGSKIMVACFIFSGFNFFASSFFTALNNGLISALISFMRTMVFQIVSVVVMAELFGVDGIWWSMTVAEFLSLIFASLFIVKYRKKYGYI